MWSPSLGSVDLCLLERAFPVSEEAQNSRIIVDPLCSKVTGNWDRWSARKEKESDTQEITGAPGGLRSLLCVSLLGHQLPKVPSLLVLGWSEPILRWKEITQLSRCLLADRAAGPHAKSLRQVLRQLGRGDSPVPEATSWR